MTHEEKIQKIRALVSGAQKANRIITVEFVKKDGTLRTMQCQRARALEATVKSEPDAATIKRKETLAARNMLCVEELCAPAKTGHQFRTINMETVRKISYAGQTYEFS